MGAIRELASRHSECAGRFRVRVHTTGGEDGARVIRSIALANVVRVAKHAILVHRAIGQVDVRAAEISVGLERGGGERCRLYRGGVVLKSGLVVDVRVVPDAVEAVGAAGVVAGVSSLADLAAVAPAQGALGRGRVAVATNV